MARTHRFRLKPLAVAIAATLSAPTVVCAQAPQPAEATLPEVVVPAQGERAGGPVEGYRATRSSTFTKTDTPLREVPASITVVPADVMKDQGMQSMSDVFRYVPGATWHQGEGNRDQVVIRGNSTTADFYVDGVRDDAQVFRDLYNLERAEVLKGPASMIFGRGGAGGLVNRVTKRPVFDSLREASVMLGSYSQFRGTLDLGGKASDGAAWRLNAMYENSDGFRNGFHLERYAVNPTATVNLEGRTSLTLGYEHLWDYRTADRGIPSFNGVPYNTDRATFFGNPDQSHARNVVDGLYAVLDHDFGGGLTVRNTTRYTDYDKYYQNVYPGSAVNAAGNLTISAYNNSNKRQNFFNQTDFTKKLTAAGRDHTLLFGFELGSQDSANKRNTGFFGGAGTAIGAIVPVTNPFALATVFRPNATDADNKVKSDTAAAYIQDQIAFSKEWKAIVGLRYDVFKVRFDDHRTLVPETDLARTDRATSPRAGLIWMPNAVSAYYISYSYAFLPSGEQLSLAPTTSDLAPEKAKNYEIGARWDIRPNLTLSSAIFRTDRTDVKVTDPGNPGSFVKSGEQRVDGIEIGLQGDIAKWWSVYGGYAYLDGRVLKPITSGTTASVAAITPAGNKIGLVPENSFALWNRFDAGGGWGAGLGLIYQSDYFTSFNNTVKVPAFWRADGALYYAFNDRATRIALNIENFLDKKYFPTVDGDNNITPGAPRTLRLTVSTAF
jgi:catecholate siderophore receptor